MRTHVERSADCQMHLTGTRGEGDLANVDPAADTVESDIATQQCGDARIRLEAHHACAASRSRDRVDADVRADVGESVPPAELARQRGPEPSFLVLLPDVAPAD